MSQNSNTYVFEECPYTKNVTIIGRNPTKHAGVIFHPRCGSWNCPYCWQINKDEWLQVAVKGTVEILDRGSMLQFVTITGRGYYTPTSSIYFMRKNWPALRKRIQYHTDKWSDVTKTEFSYLLIPERHKSGVAHWHILVATFEDRNRFWKDNAYECGFGHQAKVRNVENSVQSAGYVTKYLAKDAGQIAWPKGFRRVRTSKNWPRPIDAIPDQWDYERARELIEVEMAIEDMKALGWKIDDKRGENE